MVDNVVQREWCKKAGDSPKLRGDSENETIVMEGDASRRGDPVYCGHRGFHGRAHHGGRSLVLWREWSVLQTAIRPTTAAAAPRSSGSGGSGEEKGGRPSAASGFDPEVRCRRQIESANNKSIRDLVSTALARSFSLYCKKLIYLLSSGLPFLPSIILSSTFFGTSAYFKNSME